MWDKKELMKIDITEKKKTDNVEWTHKKNALKYNAYHQPFGKEKLQTKKDENEELETRYRRSYATRKTTSEIETPGNWDAITTL